jgi:hypothetical protein
MQEILTRVKKNLNSKRGRLKFLLLAFNLFALPKAAAEAFSIFLLYGNEYGSLVHIHQPFVVLFAPEMETSVIYND